MSSSSITVVNCVIFSERFFITISYCFRSIETSLLDALWLVNSSTKAFQRRTFSTEVEFLRFTMPPPAPLECSSPDCDFKTPVGCPSWELMVNLLNQHTQTVHGGGQAPAPQTSKLEKLPRPTFTLNMTEAQWSFTKIQWDKSLKKEVMYSDVYTVILNLKCIFFRTSRQILAWDYVPLHLFWFDYLFIRR